MGEVNGRSRCAPKTVVCCSTPLLLLGTISSLPRFPYYSSSSIGTITPVLIDGEGDTVHRPASLDGLNPQRNPPTPPS